MSDTSSIKKKYDKSKKNAEYDDAEIFEEFKQQDIVGKKKSTNSVSPKSFKKIDKLLKNHEIMKKKYDAVKEEINKLESNPRILEKGKLVYSKEITEKLKSLRKELTRSKISNIDSKIKQSIRNKEDSMLSVARSELQSVKSDMNNFVNNMISKQVVDSKDVSNASTIKQRRNSTSSSVSENSFTSDNSMNSYQSTSSDLSDNNELTDLEDKKDKENKKDQLTSEKDIVTQAELMWKTVKDYVKADPKFKEFTDKKKLQIFRDVLGFNTFMEEFPIVSRYMICMGQFKTRAFQRFLDKIKRAKHPSPTERPKNYMEDQWIRWQSDYVQYLWEEYQKRHYNNAEKQWVWQETYKRLKGEFDDFRKMHEDIEEKVKEEKDLLAAKNARELIERLTTGRQKLTEDEETKLLGDLRDLVTKKNFGIVMKQLLQKRKPTEFMYDETNELVSRGAVLLPCCGKLTAIKGYPVYNIDSQNKNSGSIMNTEAFVPTNKIYERLYELKQQSTNEKLDMDNLSELESLQKQYNFESYHKLCKFYRANTLVKNLDNEDIVSRFSDEEKKKAVDIVNHCVLENREINTKQTWYDTDDFKISCIKCHNCNGNLNNFDTTYRRNYVPYFKSTGTGNAENMPKITMIETVDVNRMNEIDDKYRPKELKGMEPILEETDATLHLDNYI